MSFIATAVGIVAVFFPDLLNLQKEKIETYRSDIFTDKEVSLVEEFLLSKIKDEKLFELDILIPQIGDKSLLSENIFILNPYDESLNTELHIKDKNALYRTSNVEGKEVFWYEIIRDGGESYEESTSFHFPNNTSFDCDDYGGTRKPLNKNSDFSCGTRIKGYFYYSPKESNPDYRIYFFREVSPENIKLKNY
ncbi:hypothetical protein ACWIWA_02840 [Ursidibacter arcticus]